MDAEQIKVGDVVLLGGRDSFWENCLLLVEEVRGWGLIGVVRGPNHTDYPLRVPFSDIVTVYRKVEVIQ
jgi:hypothetical protein